MLADGRLHLSGAAILARHLTEANMETLLSRATHKSKRQIEELVVELAPKPDVQGTMRRIPERLKKAKQKRKQLFPERVESNAEPTQNDSEPEATAASSQTPPPEKPAATEPISKGRYKVTFTASAELRDKLERLQALMRSSVPDADLAAVIEEAVTEKLERLEARRYGKTKAPRKSVEETDTSPKSRNIPIPVKRAVYTRDCGQCTFVGDNGRRCSERHNLEFHHDDPYGRGGGHDPSNLRLVCGPHNAYLAELEYGKAVMDRYRVSEPAAVYTFAADPLEHSSRVSRAL